MSLSHFRPSIREKEGGRHEAAFYYGFGNPDTIIHDAAVGSRRMRSLLNASSSAEINPGSRPRKKLIPSAEQGFLAARVRTNLPSLDLTGLYCLL